MTVYLIKQEWVSEQTSNVLLHLNSCIHILPFKLAYLKAEIQIFDIDVFAWKCESYLNIFFCFKYTRNTDYREKQLQMEKYLL